MKILSCKAIDVKVFKIWEQNFAIDLMDDGTKPNSHLLCVDATKQIGQSDGNTRECD